jgi:hypothetical protein
VEHGYNPYTYGCRCRVCRDGKAEYTRARRRAHSDQMKAVRSTTGTYVAEGIKHGLSGYQEYKCRCETCRAAKAADYRRRPRRRNIVVQIPLRLTARRRQVLAAVAAGQVHREYGVGAYPTASRWTAPNARPVVVTATVQDLYDAGLVSLGPRRASFYSPRPWEITATGRTALEGS